MASAGTELETLNAAAEFDISVCVVCVEKLETQVQQNHSSLELSSQSQIDRLI